MAKASWNDRDMCKQASEFQNDVTISRSPTSALAWTGRKWKGGPLCVPSTQLPAQRHQPAGVVSACLQHHRQKRTLRMYTYPASAPTPRSPSEMTDSSCWRQGSRENVTPFNPQVRKMLRKMAPNCVSRTSDHKLDNCQFTKKQLSKAKRYLEKGLSK